jgi:hypothetical protein
VLPKQWEVLYAKAPLQQTRALAHRIPSVQLLEKAGFWFLVAMLRFVRSKNQKDALDHFLLLATSKLKFNVGIALTFRIEVSSSQDSNWNPVRNTVLHDEKRFY